jgi:adenosylcobinamide amidohydrolase
VTALDLQFRSRREGNRSLPVVVWRFAEPLRVVASSPYGGGLGVRRWVINAQVPASYGRRDPEHHLHKLGVSLGLAGRGVGMLTAADVRRLHRTADGGVGVAATVGLGQPIWAAAPDPEHPVSLVGTINLLAWIPEPLSEAALVNCVATVAEAKAQALHDAGIEGTGTATDAVVVACPEPVGRAAAAAAYAFGGPRSRWGARLARSVHAAVLAGATDPDR